MVSLLAIIASRKNGRTPCLSQAMGLAISQANVQLTTIGHAPPSPKPFHAIPMQALT